MDTYYNQLEVANMFKISTKTLEAMRYNGTGPRYAKFGKRVLYARADLEEYVRNNLYNSTSEYH